jgi:hypothetical protein
MTTHVANIARITTVDFLTLLIVPTEQAKPKACPLHQARSDVHVGKEMESLLQSH